MENQMELKDFIEMPKEDGVYSQPWTFKEAKEQKKKNRTENSCGKRRQIFLEIER